MKGIILGSFHSFYEWGLILQSKIIEPAPIKEYKVDIQGGNGQLDFTEAFGGVHYDNRKLSFEFIKMDIIPDGFIALASLVQDLIHGRSMKIILDDDPVHYYYGRVMIKEWKSEKNYGLVKMEVDAQPYKLKINPTIVTETVDGFAEIVLNNSRMPVVPEITTDAEMQFAFDGKTYSVNAGTFRLPELVLKEGQSTVTVEGTGTVTFEYREGKL